MNIRVRISKRLGLTFVCFFYKAYFPKTAKRLVKSEDSFICSPQYLFISLGSVITLLLFAFFPFHGFDFPQWLVIFLLYVF